MDREHVIATLRQHEPELKAAGIVHLRLHGSVARADDRQVLKVMRHRHHCLSGQWRLA
jgi:predicted nucleotidyltransferase